MDELRWDHDNTNNPPYSPPTIPDTISILRKWMSHCAAEHKTCNALRNPNPPLPTRVIDVGSDCDSIRLIETNGRSGTYATLSYCWGKSGSNYITTASTLSRHLAYIPWKLLPKTVQDAIYVTRELGIPYLWVDALCIIQSSADWAVEAQKMASVYQNSLITIGVAVAADCAEGFLQQCWLPDQKTTSKDVEPSEGLSGPIDRFYYTCDRVDEARSSPLFKRAWALQELVLSHRTILFNKNGLIWLCKNVGTHCSSYGENSDVFMLHQFLGELPTLENRLNLSCSSWWTWIKDYTRRDLTFEADRVVAIAGITQHYADHTGHEPLFGLWKENLLHDLLWQAASPTCRVSPHPTWSWLSSSGPIDMERFDNCIATAEVVECHTSWKDDPLIRKSDSTKLTLRTVVLEVFVQQHEPDKMTLINHEPHSSYSSSEFPARGSVGLRDSLRTASTYEGYCYLDNEADFNQAERGIMLHCALMLIKGREFHVLMLRCLCGEQQVYQRVGLGGIHPKNKARHIPQSEWGVYLKNMDEEMERLKTIVHLV